MRPSGSGSGRERAAAISGVHRVGVGDDGDRRSRSAADRTSRDAQPAGAPAAARGHHISGSATGARSNPAAASGAVHLAAAVGGHRDQRRHVAAARNATSARASAAAARDVSAHWFSSGWSSPVSTANHPRPDPRAGARPPLMTIAACSANVSQSVAASIARSYGRVPPTGTRQGRSERRHRVRPRPRPCRPGLAEYGGGPRPGLVLGSATAPEHSFDGGDAPRGGDRAPGVVWSRVRGRHARLLVPAHGRVRARAGLVSRTRHAAHAARWRRERHASAVGRIALRMGGRPGRGTGAADAPAGSARTLRRARSRR